MSDRPVVTASHETEFHEVRRTYGRQILQSQPGVRVEVTFRLHDHEAALKTLERAVADIRSQIEETT